MVASLRALGLRGLKPKNDDRFLITRYTVSKNKNTLYILLGL